MSEKKLEKRKEIVWMQRKMRNLGLDVFGLNSLHAKKDTKSFLEHLKVARKWNPVD